MLVKKKNVSIPFEVICCHYYSFELLMVAPYLTPHRDRQVGITLSSLIGWQMTTETQEGLVDEVTMMMSE